jgi:Ca-activated chloride channel homolog
MIYIIILMLSISSIGRVDNINKLTKSAEKSFIEKKYNESIESYKLLIDSFEYKNEKIYLNLGHSYLLSGDTLNAIESYNYASLTENNRVKSIAFQQLGNINEKNNKLEEALNLYKKSIISDNNNDDSKFNYELVKRKMDKEKNKEENKKDNQEQKDNKKENSDNKNQDQKGKKEENKQDQKSEKQESQNKEENKKKKSNEESIEEKLKKINMSKKKAEMILDALNNNEFQYIQQLKRKPSKKLDKNKPDW